MVKINYLDTLFIKENNMFEHQYAIKKLKINDYRWIALKEMSQYDITEADLPFLEKLKG